MSVYSLYGQWYLNAFDSIFRNVLFLDIITCKISWKGSHSWIWRWKQMCYKWPIFGHMISRHQAMFTGIKLYWYWIRLNFQKHYTHGHHDKEEYWTDSIWEYIFWRVLRWELVKNYETREENWRFVLNLFKLLVGLITFMNA